MRVNLGELGRFLNAEEFALAFHETVHKFGGGLFQYLVRGADLMTCAVFHHGDAVGEFEGFFLVVGDVDGRHVEPGLKLGQLVSCGIPELCIQVAEGLIEEEDIGMDGEGPGEGDALLLSPTQFGDAAFFVSVEGHHAKGFGDPGRDFVFGMFSRAETEGDIFENRHMREERVVLKDHGGVSFFGRFMGHVAIVEMDCSGVGYLEAGDHS